MAKETFADYLRRVGDDYADSGAEFTAKDYRDAAKRIDALVRKIQKIQEAAIAHTNGNPTLKYIATVAAGAIKLAE